MNSRTRTVRYILFSAVTWLVYDQFFWQLGVI
jgi:hypothetical protein